MMREKRKGMMERLFVVGLLGTLVTTTHAQSNDYNTRAVDCDGGGRGYERIDDMNQDIQAERTRALIGGDPEAAYLFTLCPNLAFDAATPITPDLDNIVIGCGESLSSDDSCIVFGGTNQVEVSSFSGTDFPVTNVQFNGVTFSNFGTAAVSGENANDSTTVVLEDVIFSVSSTFESIL